MFLIIIVIHMLILQSNNNGVYHNSVNRRCIDRYQTNHFKALLPTHRVKEHFNTHLIINSNDSYDNI